MWSAFYTFCLKQLLHSRSWHNEISSLPTTLSENSHQSQVAVLCQHGDALPQCQHSAGETMMDCIHSKDLCKEQTKDPPAGKIPLSSTSDQLIKPCCSSRKMTVIQGWQLVESLPTMFSSTRYGGENKCINAQYH